MRYFILVILLVSLSLASSFQRNSRTDIVVDSEQKLMWQDDISVIKIRKNHEDATAYCIESKHAGYSGWRLPTLIEFETVVDKKNEKNYINRAFEFNVPDGYWADKAHWRTLWFYADYMHFVSGTPYYDSRHKTKYIRCVRDLK